MGQADLAVAGTTPTTAIITTMHVRARANTRASRDPGAVRHGCYKVSPRRYMKCVRLFDGDSVITN